VGKDSYEFWLMTCTAAMTAYQSPTSFRSENDLSLAPTTQLDVTNSSKIPAGISISAHHAEQFPAPTLMSVATAKASIQHITAHCVYF